MEDGAYILRAMIFFAAVFLTGWAGNLSELECEGQSCILRLDRLSARHNLPQPQHSSYTSKHMIVNITTKYIRTPIFTLKGGL